MTLIWIIEVSGEESLFIKTEQETHCQVSAQNTIPAVRRNKWHEGKDGGSNIHKDGRRLGGLDRVVDDDDLLKTKEDHTNKI